jgi:hypothetical protein
MANVLFTFDDASKRDEFVESVKASSGNADISIDAEMATESMVKFYSLFVAGQFILEGTAEEINSRFEMEVAAHKANVDIREKLDNKEWKIVRHRRTSVPPTINQ